MDSYILTIWTEFLYPCLSYCLLTVISFIWIGEKQQLSPFMSHWALPKLFVLDGTLVTIGLVLGISLSIKGLVKSKVSLCLQILFPPSLP